MRPTRIEVNLTRLKNNIEIIKGQLKPKTALMAIVKANAYGHGIVEVSNCALKSGALSLGVALPEEGARLRSAGIGCDILVLGGIDNSQIDLVLEHDLSLCLFSMDMARLINEKAGQKHKKVKIHLKIDSGMGRIGIRDKEEAIQLCATIKKMDNLCLQGIFTHFSSAFESDPNYTLGQLDFFKNLLHDIKKSCGLPMWVHAANTASIINYPQSHFNLVRAGIGIYGYSSCQDQGKNLGLQPVLSWLTKVVYLKQVATGSSISYGRTYIAKEPRTIATIPVGYGDGYSRLLSNIGWVLIRGRRAPVIGNICMDQMIVDVTEIPGVQIGDDVVLMGQQGKESIFADELAELFGTISYEVLSNISSRVPRVYVENEDESNK